MSDRQSDTDSVDELGGGGIASTSASPDLDEVVPFPGLMLNRTRIGKGIERATVRLTGFSLQSYQVAKLRRQPYSPVALVTTVGRRSGVLRTVILPYVRLRTPSKGPLGSSEAIVVVGSLGGGPRDPEWVHNLRSEARCWTTIRRRMTVGDAVITAGPECEAALEAVLEVRPFVAGYERRAASFGRRMPIVVIHPRLTTGQVP